MRQKRGRMESVLEHASGDKRFKILEVQMKRLQQRPDSLIEVLHKAQELFGYLEEDLLLFIAHGLRLPSGKVYGVATFYHFFTLKPKGKHTCVICMGTACYVKGAKDVLESVEKAAGIGVGETTANGAVSLLMARCIGSCGVAPAVVYDGNLRPRQTTEVAVKQVTEWMSDGTERT